MINEHLTAFAGKPVVHWELGGPIADPSGSHYRIATNYGDDEQTSGWIDRLKKRKPKRKTWTDRLQAFLEIPESRRVAGLIVGPWSAEFDSSESSADVVQAIAAESERLPNLKSLFIGDIISEENEISWIVQCDMSALFKAYPALEHFGVRGGESLSLGQLRHERLKTLVIESGGLPAEVVQEVAAASLPNLEHLELWLGTDAYGGDARIEDLQPILSGQAFPKLSYLGLRDSEKADALAHAVAREPITTRIQVLDLSLGNLSDEGANALATAPAMRRLSKLNISHHYCSDEAVAKLMALGIEVDASNRQEPDRDGGEVYRYIAVSE